MLGPLLLLGTYASITGYQSARPGEIAGLVLSLTLAVFVAVDIYLTVALLRAIVQHFRSPRAPLTAEPNPVAGAQSIRILALAIAARIFFGALNSIFTWAHARSPLHHVPGDSAAWSYLLVSFVPSHLPFLLLLAWLLRKPGLALVVFRHCHSVYPHAPQRALGPRRGWRSPNRPGGRCLEFRGPLPGVEGDPHYRHATGSRYHPHRSCDHLLLFFRDPLPASIRRSFPIELKHRSCASGGY